MAYQFEHFRKTSESRTPHFLVTGHPVSHSLSPVMHRKAIQFHGINAGYHAVDVRADQIADFAAWCNRDEFLGCNITIPYKQEFLKLVDRVDPAAEEVGVINTIVKEAGGLAGYNTDVFGFLAPLQEDLNQLEGERALIFGTGGASKAVKTALLQSEFEELVLVSRKPPAQDSAEHDKRCITIGYDQWPAYAEEAVLFVNTTPVGMYPDTDGLFIDPGPEETKLFEGKICYDLIYNPLQTRFLSMAEEAGAKTINGLEMLILQGSKSFELWTGKSFPVELVRKELIRYFTPGMSV